MGGGCGDGDVEVWVVVKSLEKLLILLLINANHLNIMNALFPKGGHYNLPENASGCFIC